MGVLLRKDKQSEILIQRVFEAEGCSAHWRNRSESLSRTSLKWVKFTEIRIFRTESQNLAVGRWVLARCRLGLLILQSSVGRALSGTAKKVLHVRDFGGCSDGIRFRDLKGFVLAQILESVICCSMSNHAMINVKETEWFYSSVRGVAPRVLLYTRVSKTAGGPVTATRRYGGYRR
ncbi:hypothetical protein [Oryza sativa Japonica Group]|uniref:Uncharacterized protein n=1 Tax=Oryza sativa subsp. japonica TaxID=39947 RepID=Q5ZBF3_ORYSJ|nr:hypothetical protein [Oryza sativa Japonica Group]